MLKVLRLQDKSSASPAKKGPFVRERQRFRDAAYRRKNGKKGKRIERIEREYIREDEGMRE